MTFDVQFSCCLSSGFPLGSRSARQHHSTQPVKQWSRSMKRILLAGLTLAAMSSAAFAEPVQLSSTQMDSVTAGLRIRDVNVNFANVNQYAVAQSKATAIAYYGNATANSYAVAN